jgi:hypothetical protein
VAAFTLHFRLHQREGEQAIRTISSPEWRQLVNAKEMITKRGTMAKTLAIAALTALALGMAPTATADGLRCSKATLRGTYAHTGTGVITAPPELAGPLANVGTETFDGRGGLTSSGFVSLNGNIVAVTETGTYTVNSDCTGTYTVQISPLGITTSAFFVIDDSANGLQVISTDPGVVITGIARRQIPVGDWR